MSRDHTPQEKKRLSLTHDGRNCYGECPQSARRSIRRRKANVNRSYRRATKQVLSGPSDDAEAVDDNVVKVKRGYWKKTPDLRLGDHLLRRRVRRIIERVLAGSDRKRVLDDLESQLNDSGAPLQSVKDVMRRLRSLIRSRWSTELQIDVDMANAIIEILNARKA